MTWAGFRQICPSGIEIIHLLFSNVHWQRKASVTDQVELRWSVLGTCVHPLIWQTSCMIALLAVEWTRGLGRSTNRYRPDYRLKRYRLGTRRRASSKQSTLSLKPSSDPNGSSPTHRGPASLYKVLCQEWDFPLGRNDSSELTDSLGLLQPERLVSKPHTWMDRSSEAEANMLWSTGFQLTELTVPECPSKAASRSPLIACQTKTCSTTQTSASQQKKVANQHAEAGTSTLLWHSEWLPIATSNAVKSGTRLASARRLGMQTSQLAMSRCYAGSHLALF